MARVRLGLGKLSITDKIARGRHIVARLTNNAAFPNPHPPLTEVTTTLDELEAASAQVQSAKSEVTTRVGAQDIAERKVDLVLARLGSYVESVAGLDDTLITAAGMEVKSTRTPATVPTTPEGVAAVAGEHEGEIVLSWKPVPNAYSYVIESSLDPATVTSWTHVGIATSATKTIGSLTTGKRYWFRIRAVGPAGESGWSEHATKVVP